MNVSSSSIPAKILLYSTAAVILTVGMRASAPILTTVFFSVFAALILSRWMKRYYGVIGPVKSQLNPILSFCRFNLKINFIHARVYIF